MPFVTDEEFKKLVPQSAEDVELVYSQKPASPSRRMVDYKLHSGREYHGHRPRLPLPPGWKGQELTQVYFYYFKFTADGSIRTRVYGKELSTNCVDDFRDLVPCWIEDTSASHENFETTDPEKIGWNGPCYICFFVDNPGWHLIDDNMNEGANNSLHFFKDKSDSKKPAIGNGSFFNAKTYWFDYPKNKHRKAKCLVVENHHLKDSTGEPRGKASKNPPDDYFKYDLLFNVELEDRKGSTKKLILVIDPGGRNTGP